MNENTNALAENDITEGQRFFNALFDFCYEVSHRTDDELRQELINDGIDVDALTARIESIVAKGLLTRHTK